MRRGKNEMYELRRSIANVLKEHFNEHVGVVQLDKYFIIYGGRLVVIKARITQLIKSKILYKGSVVQYKHHVEYKPTDNRDFYDINTTIRE